MIEVKGNLISFTKDIKVFEASSESNTHLQITTFSTQTKTKIGIDVVFPNPLLEPLREFFIDYALKKLPQKIKPKTQPMIYSEVERKKINSFIGLYYKYSYDSFLFEIFKTYGSTKGETIFFATLSLGHNGVLYKKEAEEIIEDLRQVYQKIVFPYLLKRIRKARKRSRKII